MPKRDWATGVSLLGRKMCPAPRTEAPQKALGTGGWGPGLGCGGPQAPVMRAGLNWEGAPTGHLCIGPRKGRRGLGGWGLALSSALRLRFAWGLVVEDTESVPRGGYSFLGPPPRWGWPAQGLWLSRLLGALSLPLCRLLSGPCALPPKPHRSRPPCCLSRKRTPLPPIAN